MMDIDNPDATSRYAITIHNAGQVNIDTNTVNNIQSNIESIGAHGDVELARILAHLTEAATNSGFNEEQLNEVLDAIGDVSEGVKQKPEDRRLPRITRAIAFIRSAASATTALGKVWAEYGHVVEGVFKGLP
jgi:hypothetical protein